MSELMMRCFLTAVLMMGSIFGIGDSKLELINAKDYPTAKFFFKDLKINESILHAILENKTAGNVFTDSIANPTFMLVCSPAGYVFLGGLPSQASLIKIVSYLKTLPFVSLVCPEDWGFKDFFVGLDFTFIERIQFKWRNRFSNLNVFKNRLQNHYSISRINEENFPQCNWHSFMLSCYGECGRFFSNGIGFCVKDQEKIVSESYGIIAHNKAEIVVVTNPDYYGQNLGASISAILLDYLTGQGVEPIWSCNADNKASLTTAKKLGFEEDCKYYFLRWVKP